MAQICDLGMKNGIYHMNIILPEGTEQFAAPLLSSIRVPEVPADFSQQAFEKSKKLAQTSDGNPLKQKMALFAAIEAASNTAPNLTYITHVLDLCRQFHITRLGPAWLGVALHDFPSSREKLIARYSEFYPKDQRQTVPLPGQKRGDGGSRV